MKWLEWIVPAVTDNPLEIELFPCNNTGVRHAPRETIVQNAKSLSISAGSESLFTSRISAVPWGVKASTKIASLAVTGQTNWQAPQPMQN